MSRTITATVWIAEENWDGLRNLPGVIEVDFLDVNEDE